MLNLEATPFFATGTSANIQAHQKRWDHSGYDQLQKEEDQGTWHQIKNPKKQKGTFEGEHNKRQGQKNHAKWLNNKQEDDLSAKVFNEAKNGGKGAKKDRKPDRQLYSVRDKRGDGQTQNSGTRSNNTRKTKGGNSFVPPLNVMKESEGLAFDDDKSFVSNVSTAISERLKNVDEDRDENPEKIALTSNNPSQNTLPNAPEETILLFNLCLGSGDRFETIFIYEGEQNYENLLDEICARHEIVERNALYFKINVLQMIVNAHSNPSAVEPTLNKLLDINYNILLSEFEQEMEDASPLFFGESDSFLTENNPEDSC